MFGWWENLVFGQLLEREMAERWLWTVGLTSEMLELCKRRKKERKIVRKKKKEWRKRRQKKVGGGVGTKKKERSREKKQKEKGKDYKVVWYLYLTVTS